MKTKNSGVYKIKNIITGDFYIGSSARLNKRLRDHKNKLSKNKHHNIILQRAYNKYGENNFIFEIICHCDESLNLYLEQQYIDSTSPYYNIAKSSSAPMIGRSHSQTSKDRMKLRKVRRGKDHPSYGTKWTEEYRQNWIKIRTGEKRSEAFKQKVTQNNLKNNSGKYFKEYHEKNRKIIIDSEGNKFPSLYSCARFHNVKSSTVCDVLKGRSKTLKRKYKVWYFDEYEALVRSGQLEELPIIYQKLIPYDE